MFVRRSTRSPSPSVVGWVSRSLLGALAGLGDPAAGPARRRAARADRPQRDRAQALLVEVQAGREAEAAGRGPAGARPHRPRHARRARPQPGRAVGAAAGHPRRRRPRAGRPGRCSSRSTRPPPWPATAWPRRGPRSARCATRSGSASTRVPALVERHPGKATLTVTGSRARVERRRRPRRLPRGAGGAHQRRPLRARRAGDASRWSGDRTRCRSCVADAGLPPGRQAVASQGTGLGLAGMAERLARGRRHAHRRPGSGRRLARSGWQVPA